MSKLKTVCEKFFLTVMIVVLTCSNALAEPVCKAAFDTSKKPAPVDEKVMTFDGQTIEYRHFTRDRLAYPFKTDLAAYKDHFLIHFWPYGHVSVFYKGHHIESRGTAAVFKKNVHREYRKAAGLPAGLVIAIKDLPKDFDAKFSHLLDNFDELSTATCIESACVTMRSLGLTHYANKKYLLPMSFLKRLLKLTAENQAKGNKSMEVLSLNEDIDFYIKNLEEAHANGKAAGINDIAFGGAIALSLGAFLLWVNSDRPAPAAQE